MQSPNTKHILKKYKSLIQQKEDDTNWEKINSFFADLTIFSIIPEIEPLLVSSILSDRSKLSGTALNFLKQAALSEEEIDFSKFINPLFKLCGRSKKVFSLRGEETLLEVIKFIHKPIIYFKEQYESLNKNVRLVTYKCIEIHVMSLKKEFFGDVLFDSITTENLLPFYASIDNEIILMLENGLKDASCEVKIICRRILKEIKGEEERTDEKHEMKPRKPLYVKPENEGFFRSIPRKAKEVFETLRSYSPFRKHVKTNEKNTIKTNPIEKKDNLIEKKEKHEEKKDGMAKIITLSETPRKEPKKDIAACLTPRKLQEYINKYNVEYEIEKKFLKINNKDDCELGIENFNELKNDINNINLNELENDEDKNLNCNINKDNLLQIDEIKIVELKLDNEEFANFDKGELVFDQTINMTDLKNPEINKNFEKDKNNIKIDNLSTQSNTNLNIQLLNQAFLTIENSNEENKNTIEEKQDFFTKANDEKIENKSLIIEDEIESIFDSVRKTDKKINNSLLQDVKILKNVSCAENTIVKDETLVFDFTVNNENLSESQVNVPNLSIREKRISENFSKLSLIENLSVHESLIDESFKNLSISKSQINLSVINNSNANELKKNILNQTEFLEAENKVLQNEINENKLVKQVVDENINLLEEEKTDLIKEDFKNSEFTMIEPDVFAKREDVIKKE